MKQLIIILGTILLGCYIFNLMVGDQDTSLKHTVEISIERSMEGFQ